MQTPRPIESIALIAALLVWGAGVARADDCLTAPNSPAPAGSHWYYHTDRAQQRNCWYLRAPSQATQQAGYIRRGAGHTHHCTQKACDCIAKRSDVNKARRQRRSTLAARQAATCADEERGNGRTCPAKRTGTKYRIVNSRGTRAGSKPVVADRHPRR